MRGLCNKNLENGRVGEVAAIVTLPQLLRVRSRILQWRIEEFCSFGRPGGGVINKFIGGQTERETGGSSHLVRGSGGSYNLVQKISFYVVKIFLVFYNLRLFMMTTNLFIIANVKQLRTVGSFRILLPFFRTSWGVGVLNSAIFNNFQNRFEFCTIGGRGAFGISGWGEV